MIDRKEVEALIADLLEPYEWTQREETSPHRVISVAPKLAADALARLLLERDRTLEALDGEMRGWDDPDDDE